MKYDIALLAKDQKVVHKYPELKEFKIVGNQNNDTYLRIAIYSADQESPFARIRDVEEKYKKIFATLNINNQKLLREIISGLSMEYRMVLFEYFKITHNVRFTTYLTNLTLFYNMSFELSSPIVPDTMASDLKNRMQISTLLDELVLKIEKAEAFLFSDDKMKELILRENTKITSWPEKMATNDPVI